MDKIQKLEEAVSTEEKQNKEEIIKTRNKTKPERDWEKDKHEE